MPHLVENKQDMLLEANSKLLLLIASHIRPDGNIRCFNVTDQESVKELCSIIADCLPSET